VFRLDNAQKPQTEPATGPSTPRFLPKLALAAVAVLGLAALWLSFGRSNAEGTGAPISSDVTPQSDTDGPEATTNTTSPESGPPRTQASAGPDASGHEQRERHPLTPEHVRIQNDNQMLGALNDATDIKNVERLRQLVEAWNRAHHEDPEKFGEAYTVIADCLEFPGEASRAKGRRFYDDNRASTLRRYIRRHCKL
jgi:hypothetical protein